MGTIKVTFYNNNRLTVNNIPSDSSGIYFQPSDEIINNKLPAHIVHNGLFYTYGSYVIDIENKDSVNYQNGYVVTDIISNQYAKTLTVHKQKLNLSELENKINNYASNFDKLCGSSASLKLGNDYNIRLSVDRNSYQFVLSSTTLEDPSCEIKINNGTYTSGTISYNLSASVATIYIGNISHTGAKVNRVTVSSSKYTGNINNLFTTNANNTITIKNNIGWGDTLANSYNFNIDVELGPKDTSSNSNINTVTQTFTCTLNKIRSKATPTTTTLTLDENKQTISTSTILRNVEPASAEISYSVNLTDKLQITNNTLKFKDTVSTYSFSNATTNFTLTYNISTSATDIYYNTSGTINGTITASKWRVNFKNGSTTVKTIDGYYSTNVTFPTKPSDYTEGIYKYTFDCWKDSKGNKYTSLTFGQAGVDFGTSHTLTLNAHFTQTQQAKYYWYVGQDNPANLPDNFDPEDQKVTDTSSPGWRYIGTSVPTYGPSKMLWEGAVNPITTGTTKQTIYVALPNSTIKLRDGDGNVVDNYTNIGTEEIKGVKYYIYQSPVPGKTFVPDIY